MEQIHFTPYIRPPSIGLHVLKGSGYLNSLKAVDEQFSITAAQIFVSGPKTYKDTVTDNECATIKEYVDNNNIELFVHSSYVTSLKMKSGWLIQQQMQHAYKCNARGVVIHIPKAVPDVVAGLVTELLSKYSTDDFPLPLLLEPPGIKPSVGTYSTAEKINTLMSKIKYPLERIGFVLDTAHLWASGTDVSSKQLASDFLSQLVEPERIRLIHLNGSYAELGLGKDKHAVPFSSEDNIWGSYITHPQDSGVAAIVEFAKKYNVTFILEVNRDAINLVNIEDYPGSLEIIRGLF